MTSPLYILIPMLKMLALLLSYIEAINSDMYSIPIFTIILNLAVLSMFYLKSRIMSKVHYKKLIF